jgi:type I restriction enzyme S subunit
MKHQHRYVPLGSLVQPQKAKAFGKKDPRRPYLGLEHLAQGQPVLLGSANSSDSVSVNSVFEKGDILFGKLRPNLRKCVAAPFDGYCSTDILVLRAREGVDQGFAACVLQSAVVFEAAVQSAVGTKMPRTNWEALAVTRVFAPADRNEQRFVAWIFHTLDGAIQQTEALLAKQQRINTGLMHDLLTRGLDAQGRIRDPSTHRFKPSRFGSIPEEWNVSPLESQKGPHRAFIRTGPFGTAIKQSDWKGTGVPVITW